MVERQLVLVRGRSNFTPVESRTVRDGDFTRFKNP